MPKNSMSEEVIQHAIAFPVMCRNCGVELYLSTKNMHRDDYFHLDTKNRLCDAFKDKILPLRFANPASKE